MKPAYHYQVHDFANIHYSQLLVLQMLHQLHRHVIRNGVTLHVSLATAV